MRLVTENWYELLAGPSQVRQLLEATHGRVELLIDLGNWKGSSKYADLAEVAGFAETCHAKCHRDAAGELLLEDYRRSLQVLADAAFEGSLALVYEGRADEEWNGLAVEREMVRQVFRGI